MIKVLWLSNTPSGALMKLSPDIVAGGWMQSLEDELVGNENIQLSLAFYYYKPIDDFVYKKTHYYPIFRDNTGSKLGRLKNRVFSNVNSDNKELLYVKDLVEKIKPDIIHVHGTEDNWGLIQKYTDIPTVVSIQGILNPYTEKFFSGIPKNIAVKNESVYVKLAFNSAKMLYARILSKSIREKEILKLSKNIIGRTDWDRRVTNLLTTSANYYLGNEIIRSVFYEHTWEKEEYGREPFKIVSTSTGGMYKGLEMIVKSAQLLKENSTLNFEWTVIGQNEKDSFPSMIKKWLKFNYADINIKFVGKMQADEMIGVLLSSDVYCQVSHIENSPNSLCEAMLLGIPIVASFAGGTDSMLENKKEGILVQDGDSYSCAGAILQLYEDFSLAQQYGVNAKKRAHSRHDKKSIVKSLVNTYCDILSYN